MNPEENPRPKHTRSVSVRLTSEEFRRLSAKANRHKVSLGHVIRLALTFYNACFPQEPARCPKKK